MSGDESKSVVVCSVSSPQVTMSKLTGKNFRSWLTVVRAHAAEKKLEDALFHGMNVSQERDLQARIFLFSTLDDNHVEKVSSCATAKDMMERLTTIYADNSAVNTERLLERFFEHQFKVGETMSNHIARLESMRLELSNMGQSLSDGVFMAKLLSSLPENYSNMKSGWDFAHPDTKTIPSLVSHILKTEEKLKEENDVAKALLAKRPQSGSKDTMSIEERKRITRCGKCGHKGHWHRECSTRPENYIRKPGDKEQPVENASEKEKQRVSLNVGDLDASMRDMWLSDSGASNHMCNRKDWFSELVLYPSPRACTVGNGERTQILGEGKVEVVSSVGENEVAMTLNEVLLVLELPANLLSVGAADSKGIETKFEKGECKFLQDSTAIAVGRKLEGNLYLMQIVASKAENYKTLICSAKRSLEEWHQVLGHPGSTRLATLLDDDSLGLQVLKPAKSEGNQLQCEHCPSGKARRVHHPLTDRVASEPGVLHVDLSGKVSVPSIGNFLYYMVAKDEATEFCYVYLLKNKTEVVEALADLIVQFEVKSGYQVQELHSDNGSEFVNEKTRLLFLKERIIHETSAPRTPQQNGRIEREMGSITNVARTLLRASALPDSLWDEAVLTACYLRNRLPTKRSSLTPFERLMGKKPSLKHLITFGTEVHVIANWDYRSKFESRTEQGFLVGFTARSNTYRVYVPVREAVVVTSDIVIQPHKKVVKSLDSPFQQDNPSESTIVFNEITFAKDQDSVTKVSRDPKDQLNLMEEFFSRMRNEGIVNRSFEDEDIVGIDKTQHVYPPTLTSVSPLQEGSIDRSGNQEESSSRQIEPPMLSPHHSTQLSECNELSPFRGRSIPRSPQKTSVEKIGSETDATSSTELGQENVSAQRPVSRSSRFPKLFLSKLDSLESISDLDKPSSYDEATTGPNKDQWIAAIRDELLAHETNGTWVEIDRPENGTSLTAKWVFTVKRDKLGNIEKYKARLVARGYKQREGIDYRETFAPVARIESIRLLLAICALKRYDLAQFDVSSAFLHGTIEEEIYMEAPQGIDIANGRCLKLKKALYGLKQAPKCWNSKFDSVMRQLDFVPTICDPCIYVSSCHPIYVAVYVDDGLVISDDIKRCNEIITKLNEQFTTRTMNGGSFLGMELTKIGHTIFLSQEKYINDLVEKYRLTGSNMISTPLADTKSLFNYDQSPRTKVHYREAIGSLLYCAMNTRPDVLFPVILLARFCEDPREIHFNAVLRVVKYLKSTREVGLLFKPSSEGIKIEAYSDSDLAGDPTDSKSTSGVVILVSGCPITFISKKQSITAQSTAESEYVAASQAARELEWVTSILTEMRIGYEKPLLFVDNLSTIRQIRSNQINSKSKHIRLKFHFIKQLYDEGILDLVPVGSNHQRADFLTKAMAGPRLKTLSENCGVMKPEADFQPITTTQNQTPKMMRFTGLKPSLLLIYSTLIICSWRSSSTALKWERAQNLVWIPMDYRVDEGAIEMDLDLIPISVCDSIGTLNQDEQRKNFTHRAYSRLRDECMKTHQEKLEPLFEELEHCLPPDSEQPRYKRVVWIIAGILVGLVAVAIIAAVVVTAVYVANLSDRMETMNKRQEKMETELNAIRKAFHEADGANNATAEALKSLAEKSEANRRMIEELGSLLPEVSWNSAYLYYRQRDDIKNFREIIHSCRSGRVAIEALADLSTIRDLRQFEERDTVLKNVTKRFTGDQRFFKFEFIALKRSKSTKVYKLQAFDTYMDLQTDPYVLTYKGPKFVIYNATSNCTKGIEYDSTIGAVLDSCSAINYRDPMIDKWERKNTTDTNPMDPRVIKLRWSKVIYCTYHNITIENENVLCPPFPVSISLDKNFSTTGISHVAERVYYKGPMSIERVHTNPTKLVEVDQEFIDQMVLIQEVRAKNARIRELLRQKETSSSALAFNELELEHIIGILSLVTSCLTCLCWCLKRTSGNEDHVTVVNSTPMTPPPSIAFPVRPEGTCQYPVELLHQMLGAEQEAQEPSV